MSSDKKTALPMQADVVIIGSGLAGTAAAYEAAKAGADVLVMEKMKYEGGNSALAGGGYACWDSALKLRQKLGLGEDSFEQHMEDTLRAGKYLNDPILVETMVKNAPAGLDWLCAAGVPFKNVLVKLGGYSAPRAYQAACSGKEMMEKAKAYAISAGAKYISECEVTGIVRDLKCTDSKNKAEGNEESSKQEPSELKNEGISPVTGVVCRYCGETHVVKAAKGVIIASGGFSSDVKMRKEVRPDLDESFGCSNHKGATGEMIRYARNIGADTIQLDQIQLYPCANPKTGSVDRWAFYCYSGAGFGMIYVDGSGRRFANELEGRAALTQIQVRKCAKPTWAILNGEIVKRLGMTGQEVAAGEQFGRMQKSETIRGLAKKIGADPAILEQTILDHNQMVKGEKEDRFGKKAIPAFASMENGPYYAIAQWPSVHFTLGGLRIDKEAHVLDKNGAAIPGLFAAGEVCGGVHGADRMGGNALAECVVFGRIAGRNAVGRNV